MADVLKKQNRTYHFVSGESLYAPDIIKYISYSSGHRILLRDGREFQIMDIHVVYVEYTDL